MAVQTYETRLSTGRVKVPWISWSAIFGGLASGMATFLLLALLGLAAGITAINPEAAEPVGRVPLMAGIWTGISMLLSAFVGGFVAARISGLSRRSDGIFHGFVTWGVSTLLFAYLVTTSVGNLLGGVFNVLGQGLQATGSAVSGAVQGGGATAQGQGGLQSLLGGAGGTNISRESLETVRQQLSAGDRQGAIDTMVNQMGIAPDRAQTIADQGMKLQGAAQQLPSGEEVASKAVTGLTVASWWLFAGILLSLILGVAGGATGARGSAKRRSALVAH